MPYLIVGLGNPGKEYAATRHNVGFVVVDALAHRLEAAPVKTKLLAEILSARAGGQAVQLMKPQTFMNLSGNAVVPFMKTKKIPAQNLTVIHDDIDLPFGMIRVSKNASAGGHNGAKSIIDTLGTKEFMRIRIGVGRPAENIPVDNYVLGKFSPEEKKELPGIIEKAVEKIEEIIFDAKDKN